MTPEHWMPARRCGSSSSGHDCWFPSSRWETTAADAVAEICRRLDGIPLAIELAAARVKMLSVEEIRARLDDRFRLLTGGSKTAMARQQTLLATIQWSYDHLAPRPAAAVAAALGICRRLDAGWRRARGRRTAGRVCGAGRARASRRPVTRHNPPGRGRHDPLHNAGNSAPVRTGAVERVRRGRGDA